MNFWRISRFHDLSGLGTIQTFGRWHVPGARMVYMADSPAGVLLEICAHTSGDDVPRMFALLKIGGPESEAEEVSRLPKSWVNNLEATQAVGSEWLRTQRTALLRVPSALVPESRNYLLNPLHSDALAFKIERVYEYPFDLRLKG